MNKTTTLLFIYLTFLILGCSSKHNLNLIGEKEYINGFLGNSKIATIDGKMFLCHYDLVTHKKIIAESLVDDEKHIIDLAEVIDSNSDRIKAFEIIDWNHIFLFPGYSSYLLDVDIKNQTTKKIDLEKYLNQEGKFMLMNHTGSFIFNDTSMIFPLEFRPESLPLDLRDDLQAYDKARYTSPRLFKIDNFKKDSLTVHFGTRDLYKRFVAETVLAYDKNNYRFINNKIIYSSMYTDSIYTIDPITLEVTGSYKIESNYTGLIVKHITRQNFIDSEQNLLMYNAYSNGNIIDIAFDKISQNYLVSVIHNPLQEGRPEGHLKWSFVILDSSFTKIDEIVMDETQYNQACHSTDEGLYLASNTKHANDSNYFKKNSYAIFKYD